jgi:hypothetical protein
MLAREGCARLRWLGWGQEGKGEMGTGRRSAFVLNEIGSVARAERGKKGVGVGASAWRREKEGEGGLRSDRQ